MSHFTVAVFMPDDKQSVDDLLAPYNENISAVETEDCNPDAKWDYYTIGGRWHGMLTLKQGKTGLRDTSTFGKDASKGYDAAFVSDIDFEAMKQYELSQLPPYEKEMKNPYMKEEYMRKRFPTEEDYIERMSAFHTYAVITPDGKWHAPGNMGWFGISSETPEEERAWQFGYYDRFIKPAIENNWYVVIVDCHI